MELTPPSAPAEASKWLKISVHLLLRKKKIGLEMDTNPNETREVNPKACSEARERVSLYSWTICCELMKAQILIACRNFPRT